MSLPRYPPRLRKTISANLAASSFQSVLTESGIGTCLTRLLKRIGTSTPVCQLPASAGRVGNSGVGILEGPGTVAIAGGLSKSFALRKELECALKEPSRTYPTIRTLQRLRQASRLPALRPGCDHQTAENSVNRNGQLSGRINF
jgi:hypothetical protein